MGSWYVFLFLLILFTFPYSYSYSRSHSLPVLLLPILHIYPTLHPRPRLLHSRAFLVRSSLNIQLTCQKEIDRSMRRKRRSEVRSVSGIGQKLCGESLVWSLFLPYPFLTLGRSNRSRLSFIHAPPQTLSISSASVPDQIHTFHLHVSTTSLRRYLSLSHSTLNTS